MWYEVDGPKCEENDESAKSNRRRIKWACSLRVHGAGRETTGGQCCLVDAEGQVRVY